jgi:uncharacterized membrane protein YqjE
MMIFILTTIGVLSVLASAFLLDWRLRKIENTISDMEADRERLRHDLACTEREITL